MNIFKEHIRIVVVDLDGTLIHSDSLFEQLFALLRHPLYFLFVIPSLIQSLAEGKSAFKVLLADVSVRLLHVETLPYCIELLELLKELKEKGFQVFLCTGAHSIIANKIADHLNIFDGVFASSEKVNLVGKNKARILLDEFAGQPFFYAGNASVDLHVWKISAGALVVNAPAHLIKKVELTSSLEKVIVRPSRGIRLWFKALRIHQWIKNLLIFAPLIASHQFLNLQNWWVSIETFICFGCVASSVYLQNDLLDLPHDRLHPRKRLRPFASGQLPLEFGFLFARFLLCIGLFGAWVINAPVFAWLSGYFFLTFAYSIKLKGLVILDCIVLAVLYTLRIIAGAAAIHNQLSHWLLGFSFFLFFSLAMMKRYAELETKGLDADQKIKGRGYRPSDSPLVLGLGLSAAFCSILVLALYLNSDQVLKLYRLPEMIWVGVPVLLFWASWMWLKAHRGEMLEDPVLFAAKDIVSLVSGTVLAIVFLVATLGL